MATRKIPPSPYNGIEASPSRHFINLAIEFLRLRSAVLAGGICLLISNALPWPRWVQAPGLPPITGDGAGRIAAVLGLLLLITGLFAEGEVYRRYSLLSALLGSYALVLAFGGLGTAGGIDCTGSLLALLGAFLSVYGGLGFVR